MARYFIIHNEVTISCGIVQVVQRSKTLQHLWLFWSTKLPTVKPVPFRGQQSTVPHQNNHALEIQGFVEQEEPGNTDVHTFHFGWPTGARYLFLYSTNLGSANLKASRSPLFAYELDITPVFRETWTTQPLGDNPWSFNGFDTVNDVHPIGNLLIANGDNTFGASLLSNLRNIPEIASAKPCDLFVSFGGYATPFAIAYEVGCQLLFENLIDGTQAQRVIKLVQTNPDFCIDYFEGIVRPQAFAGTSEIRSALLAITGNSVRPCQPFGPEIDDEWQLVAIDFYVTRTGPGLQNVNLRLNNVTIGLQNGQMKDVTGQWRNLRLAPFLP